MSKQNYRNLINDLCNLTQIPTPLLEEPVVYLILREIEFTLQTSDDLNSSFLYIHCDMGLLPATYQEAAKAYLLETNFYMFGAPIFTSFSQNKSKGHIVLSIAQPFLLLSPKRVLEQMNWTASIAHSWRERYFWRDLLNLERDEKLTSKSHSQQILRRGD